MSMSNVVEMDPDPATQLVRRFSEQWLEENPNGTMERALSAKVASDDEDERRQRLTFAPIDGAAFARSEEVELANARTRLLNAWQKFQKKLPKEQRSSIDVNQPDLQYLFQTIQAAANKWESNSKTTGSGKAKTKFRDLCRHLDNHKTIFSVFPKEDKYFSIFAGSLTTIVQAAANHIELTEEVGLALGDLGEDIDFWYRHQHEIKTDKMRLYIIDLYVVLFEFFTDIFLQWSQSSLQRVWTSLNAKAVATIFTSKRKRLHDIQQRLLREIEADNRSKNDRFQRQTAQELCSIKESVDQMRELFLKCQTEQGFRLFKDENEAALAYDAQKLLIDQANHHIIAFASTSGVSQTKQLEPVPGKVVSPLRQIEDVSDVPVPVPNLVDGLGPLKLRLAQHLQAISGMSRYISRPDIDAQVQRQVLAWVGAQENTILWIEGPSAVARPSQNTATSLMLTVILRRSQVHYVQSFVGTMRQPGQDFNFGRGLLDMVLNITMQLISIASDQPTSNLSFLKRHLQSLNEGSISLEDALNLLRRTRLQIPGPVAFIVDCLQDLENRDDQSHMENLSLLLGVFCQLCEPSPQTGSQTHITKICFTTDGYVAVLGAAFRERLLSKIAYTCEADDKTADDLEVLT